jgi:hypothetical protein
MCKAEAIEQHAMASATALRAVDPTMPCQAYYGTLIAASPAPPLSLNRMDRCILHERVCEQGCVRPYSRRLRYRVRSPNQGAVHYVSKGRLRLASLSEAPTTQLSSKRTPEVE